MKFVSMHITHSQTLVEIITDTQNNKKITVWPSVELNYLVVLRDDAHMDIIIDGEENSSLHLKVLCIGQQGHSIHSNIITSLIWNHAQANVTILSLLKDGSDINVHGSIILAPDVVKVSGHLSEENLILGEKIKIRTAPILDVRSSDVSASHGCKIERLDPKRLFYMQSRGLSQNESQSLILDGYLHSLFEWFEGQEKVIQDIKELLHS